MREPKKKNEKTLSSNLMLEFFLGREKEMMTWHGQDLYP
jgi:hypothetical protein